MWEFLEAPSGSPLGSSDIIVYNVTNLVYLLISRTVRSSGLRTPRPSATTSSNISHTIYNGVQYCLGYVCRVLVHLTANCNPFLKNCPPV